LTLARAPAPVPNWHPVRRPPQIGRAGVAATPLSHHPDQWKLSTISYVDEVNDVVKLLIGMVKGLVIGGAIGYGAYALGLGGGFNWVTYGAVGAMVGLLVGRPLWSLIMDKNGTTVVSMLKAIFGFGVGCGLYALVAKVWGGFNVELSGVTRNVYDWQPILGAAIGGVYGGFVELDDSVDDKAKKKLARAEKARLGDGKKA
jgi:hypothetical protein